MIRFSKTLTHTLSRSNRPISASSFRFQKQEPPKEPKQPTPQTSKINLYQSKNELVEGSKIEHYMKKKSLGFTDDESTTTGKVKAKAKDFTALIATGFAGFMIISALGLLYKTYFKKTCKDYLYEKASEIQMNSNELVDHIGVDFKILKNEAGTKTFGDKVIASEKEKFSPDNNKTKTSNENSTLESMTLVNYIDNGSGRSIMAQSVFIKKAEDTDDINNWMPYLCLVTLDYKNKMYNKKIIVCDNREAIRKAVRKFEEEPGESKQLDLNFIKMEISASDELKKLEMDEKRKTEELKIQLKKEKEDYEFYDALGIGSSDNKNSGSGNVNFAAGSGSENSGDSVPVNIADNRRTRPKF